MWGKGGGAKASAFGRLCAGSPFASPKPSCSQGLWLYFQKKQRTHQLLQVCNMYIYIYVYTYLTEQVSTAVPPRLELL